MISEATIKTNNLNSPEDFELLMFLLENHPLEAPGAQHINQIERERPGVYTMVLRFQDVAVNCVAVGKRIDDDVAERIRLAIEKNQRELTTKARRYFSLWRHELKAVHELRKDYNQQTVGLTRPDAIASVRKACETAIEGKMEEIRQRTERQRKAAFPLYNNGGSWYEFVKTVLYRFQAH